MRREDMEALGGELGQSQLNSWSDSRLLDLPAADQHAIIAHLQARDWFLDRARFEQMQTQPLRELVGDSEHDLIDILRREQLDDLRNQRLATLGRDQRLQVQRALQDLGLDTEEGQARSLQRQRLGELDADVYGDLSSQLGSETAASWGAARFQDLDREKQALMAAYLGRQIMGRIERRVLLHTISRLWIDYLTDIEDLRRGIGLEAYGQRDPLIEYKRRAFELFAELGDNIRRTVVRSLFQQAPQPLGAD
jgi:preprotein translocase subunit SecA